MDDTTPARFLAPYPEPIQAQSERLRALVKLAVPDVVERVRMGWRLIGYDVVDGRRRRYFAYVAPEREHVHIGLEYGAAMTDPEQILEGAQLGLRQVRYLTFRPGEPIPEHAVIQLTREAARIAVMSRRDRTALTLDRGWSPAARLAPIGGDRAR